MRKTKYQTIAAVVLICGWVILFGISGIAQKTLTVRNTNALNTWAIHSSAILSLSEGGRTFSLDSAGNLQKRTKNIFESKKIVEPAELQQIAKLVQKLNLPRTKSRTVKGKGLYDYSYSNLTIMLNGKSFIVEGSSFDDEEFLVLTATQRKTLDQLKRKLETFKTESAVAEVRTK